MKLLIRLYEIKNIGILRKGESLNSNTISIRTTIAWIAIYLIVCGIIPTTLDKMIWETLKNEISAWLNLLTLIALNSIFSLF